MLYELYTSERRIWCEKSGGVVAEKGVKKCTDECMTQKTSFLGF